MNVFNDGSYWVVGSYLWFLGQKSYYYYFLFGFSLWWDPVWSHNFSFVGAFLLMGCFHFPLSTFTCAFWRCSYKSNPTMQFTHLSQIYLPMINNFVRPTQALFQSRLPFDSLNKITTMISVIRLQMEIDERTNIKENQI